MENKINIAELLKDCPKGMELDSTTYDNCTLEIVFEGCLYPIQIRTPEGLMNLTKYGSMSPSTHSKCVIFPKGKTTWDGFHRPFKDGDILAIGDTIYIYNGIEDNLSHGVHVIVDSIGLFAVNTFTKRFVSRFATEEEKEKLFDAIRENGYHWNEETKTLEKLPYFKIGDKIRHKNDKTIIKTINYIYHDSYALCDNHLLYFKEQDEWELISNKFDITTLKPFDKVLVRDCNEDKWNIDFFGYYRDEGTYQCMTFTKNQCIPYEVNKELLGTTNNPKGYGSE